MASRLLYEKSAPTTQTNSAVKELLVYLGRPADPLPQEVDLGGMFLVLSNKRDCYYVVTENDCSCPSKVYRPKDRCKHMRKYYPKPPAPRSMADALNEKSIKPTGKWPHGYNGPVNCPEAV